MNTSIRRFVLFVSLFVIGTACTYTYASAKSSASVKKENRTRLRKQRANEYDVFLLIGQSNMAGRGEIYSEDTGAIDGVWILDGKDRVIPADVPLNRHSTVRKAYGMQGMNPAYGFAKRVAARTGRKILLVVNARGATAIEQWMKDAPDEYRYAAKAGDDADKEGLAIPSLYGEAVRRGREGMKYGTLRAVLWHQGEGNSGKTASARYLEKLGKFVNDLRADLGVGAEVPFIAGEICRDYKNAPYFNPEISRIGSKIENAHCVSAEGCGSNADRVHFSREGQILLGERYADKVLETVYE